MILPVFKGFHVAKWQLLFATVSHFALPAEQILLGKLHTRNPPLEAPKGILLRRRTRNLPLEASQTESFFGGLTTGS